MVLVHYNFRGPPQIDGFGSGFWCQKDPYGHAKAPGSNRQRSLWTREEHKDPYRHAKGIITIQIPYKTGPPPYSFGLFVRKMVSPGPRSSPKHSPALPETPRDSRVTPGHPGGSIPALKTVENRLKIVENH